jgi:RimJ/RimL family protein N-acetyltransferase
MLRPVLRGELVELATMEPADIDCLFALSGDLAVRLLVESDPPKPMPRARFQSMYDEDNQREKWPVQFAIRVDGRAVGTCALFEISDVHGTAQLGISVDDATMHGKGYGTDAVRTLVGYGFRVLNLRRVWLRVDADNAPAIASYRKAGFVEEGRLREHTWRDGAYRDGLVMAVLRS